MALPTVGLASAPSPAATTALQYLGNVSTTMSSVYQTTGTNEHWSSPAVGDLNADGKPEIVVATLGGAVAAMGANDGQQRWKVSLGATALHASPLIVDVDSNGSQDVVAATMDGRVVWINGQTGGVIRTFREGAPLHCPPNNNCRPHGFFSTPAVGDVNGDGKLDIVAGSYDHTVYVWSYNGTQQWRKFLYDTIWSSPAIADVDGNGTNEVIIGSDLYTGNPLNKPGGGAMWVLRGSNGNELSGYPKSLPSQTQWSSPALGDINGDGKLDIVVGSGINGDFGSGTAAKKVWAFTAFTGANLPGWPVTPNGRVMQQPALADLDRDGKTDVVVATDFGYLQAYKGSGAQMWSTCNATDRNAVNCANGGGRGGVVIADVDSDGVQEVISTLGKYLRVFDGSNKTLEAEIQLPGSGYMASGSAPAIGEMNGKAIIVHTAVVRADGQGWPAAGDSIRSDIFTSNQPLCKADWAQFKYSAKRSSIPPKYQPWHPFPCARPFIEQQYLDLLGRPSDAAGLEYWNAQLQSGQRGAKIVELFINSPEFKGIVAPAVEVRLATSNATPGTSEEIKADIEAIRSGLSREDLAAQHLAGLSGVTDSDLITDVYRRIFARAASSAERSAAQNQISTESRQDWVADLLRSASAQTALAKRVLVAMSYVGLLDRAPDSGGYTYWVNQVNGGVDARKLFDLFLQSPEYRGRVLTS